jgi:hypothetical protein
MSSCQFLEKDFAPVRYLAIPTSPKYSLLLRCANHNFAGEVFLIVVMSNYYFYLCWFRESWPTGRTVSDMLRHCKEPTET